MTNEDKIEDKNDEDIESKITWIADNTNEKNKDDLNVLGDIISALKKFSPDVRQRLIQTVATFFEMKGVESESGVGKVRSSLQEAHRPSFSEDRKMTPKEFLLEKQPQTDVEKVACLAYYLTQYRDTPHFKTIEISKLNTEAAQRKFNNAAMAVNNAMSSGYLVPSTKGQKQLSASGELFVQALPDRVQAKEAMIKAQPRKRNKSVTKKEGTSKEE